MLTANFKVKNKQDISVSWSNVDDLYTVISRQTTNFGKSHKLSKQELQNEIEAEYQIIFDFVVDNVTLPQNPVIVDIGSGSSVVDMALYKYYDQNARIYLLDGSLLKDDFGGHPMLHHQDFKPFNRWDPVADAILTNKFKASDFKVMSTKQEWPADLKADLILSNCSWGLHYPIETYWEKVKSALKPGGYLVIRPLLNINNAVELISTTFGKPKVLDHTPFSEIKNNRPVDYERWRKILPDTSDSAIWGYRGTWQRPL